MHKTNLTSQIPEGHTVGSAFCGQPQDRDGAVPLNWKMLSETLVRNVISTAVVLSVRVTEKAAEAESERPLLSGTQTMGKIHFTQSVMRACAGTVPSEGLGCRTGASPADWPRLSGASAKACLVLGGKVTVCSAPRG